MVTKKEARRRALEKRAKWEADMKATGEAALNRDRQRRADQMAQIELKKLRDANAYLDSREMVS